jgi:methylated-DNA-[protein]-cysteine S-methyltransferase
MANTTVSTPVGPFSIIASGSAVLSAGFTDDLDELVASIHPTLRDDHDADADFDDIVATVGAYFSGDLSAIDTVKVDQRSGGQFLDHAWETLRRVPGGVPVTYKALAAQAGRPLAIRAAAQACARNTVGLFVPCHRVVRTDGGLGGYRWGLDIKRWLLNHEQASAPTTTVDATAQNGASQQKTRS